MANLKLHTIGIHGGFHHNFLYTVVRTVCRQENAIVSLHIHRAWEGNFRDSLYARRGVKPFDCDAACANAVRRIGLEERNRCDGGRWDMAGCTLPYPRDKSHEIYFLFLSFLGIFLLNELRNDALDE